MVWFMFFMVCYYYIHNQNVYRFFVSIIYLTDRQTFFVLQVYVVKEATYKQHQVDKQHPNTIFYKKSYKTEMF